jgi:hypothetical protein
MITVYQKSLCTFCLDTKSTKKIKADENYLKLSSLVREKNSPTCGGFKQLFPSCFCSENFLTVIFIGRFKSKRLALYHRLIHPDQHSLPASNTLPYQFPA